MQVSECLDNEMEEDDNPQCGRISNNLCRYFASKKLEQNFLFLKCGLLMVTSYQTVGYRKVRENSNFTVEKPDKHSARLLEQ